MGYGKDYYEVKKKPIPNGDLELVKEFCNYRGWKPTSFYYNTSNKGSGSLYDYNIEKQEFTVSPVFVEKLRKNEILIY